MFFLAFLGFVFPEWKNDRKQNCRKRWKEERLEGRKEGMTDLGLDGSKRHNL
jgi:hypothetical protein